MSFPKDCLHPAGTCQGWVGDAGRSPGQTLQAKAVRARSPARSRLAGGGISVVSVRCLRGHWLGRDAI